MRLQFQLQVLKPLHLPYLRNRHETESTLSTLYQFALCVLLMEQSLNFSKAVDSPHDRRVQEGADRSRAQKSSTNRVAATLSECGLPLLNTGASKRRLSWTE